MGDVLLTARMGQIFLRFRQPILTRNVPFRKGDAEREVIQPGHSCPLPKRQPTPGVESAGEFDLHDALALAGLKRQPSYSLLIQIECNGHVTNMTLTIRPVKHNVPRPRRVLVGAGTMKKHLPS